MKVYEMLAQKINAYLTCNEEHALNAEHYIRDEIDTLLPSGSGFDSGSAVSLIDSKQDRLVINTSYHHMNENGYYTRWSDHDVILTPSFIGGFDIRVTGRNINDIKDYIADTFYHALSETID